MFKRRSILVIVALLGTRMLGCEPSANPTGACFYRCDSSTQGCRADPPMDEAACDASAAMACSPNQPMDVVFEPGCTCPDDDVNTCVNLPDWYEDD